MIRRLGFLLLTFVCLASYSQVIPDGTKSPVAGSQAYDAATAADLKFVNYLLGKNENDDAIFMLKRLKMTLPGNPALSDTLNYFLAWAHYAKKELDTSAFYFLKVTPQSASYAKSRFFASYEMIHLKHYGQAAEILQSFQPEPGILRELHGFEKAGLALLQRNIPEFEQLSAAFTYSYFPMAKEEKDLVDFKDHIKQHKNKSMAVAAILSAILPGSGKVYAGKTGEGIGAFLVVLSLGLVSRENILKDGLTNYKSLIFGSLFSVYYIGNIWGSAISAKRSNDQYSYEMDNRILFNIHIPLRNLFN